MTTTTADGTLQVTASDQAIIRWQSFDIAAGERVQFLQPSPAASALNRVVGGAATQIAGYLGANGLLFLINPAGIHFASSATVEVGGLVASSLDLTNTSFLNRSYQFLQPEGAAPGTVVNHGTLRTTEPGGLIGLLGGAVANRGTMVAELGTVALAAGSAVTLSFGDSIAVVVDQPTQTLGLGPDGRVTDAAANTGTISAPGGVVTVTASAAQQLFARVINNTGIIEATSVLERAGRIFLVGHGGTVRQAGTVSATGGRGLATGGQVIINAPSGHTVFPAGALIDVSGGAAGGDGGFVELSGRTLEFGGRVGGEAQPGYRGGRLLVDPLNLLFNTSTQASPPNNPTGTPDIAFNDAPVAGTTTIQIADIVGFAEAWFEAIQDITINNPLTMNNNNDLVLRAGRNINVNANVRVRGNNGHMTLVADADFSAGGGVGSDGVGTIVQAAGTEIRAGNGTMTLQTGGDYTVRAIRGGNSGTISVTSTGGSILDDGDASTRLRGGTVTLTANAAGQGVGTTGALNTDLTTLNLNVGSGGAAIHDVGSFTLNTPTVAAGGSLALQADSNITLANGATVAVSGAGTLTLTADADSSGAGRLVMNSGSSLVTGGGAITINGSDDMTIRTINAGSGAVTISGVAGGTDIRDDGDNTTRITAGTLTVTADRNIGGSGGTNQLDTSVGILAATTINGDLFLANDQALSVTSATIGGSGNDITLTTTAGDLSLGTLTAADDLVLTAAGAVRALAGMLITGDRLTLTAGADAGTAAAPLRLGALATTSTVDASSGSAHLRFEAGDVTINSQGIAGGVSTLGTSRGTIMIDATSGDLTLQVPGGSLLSNGVAILTAREMILTAAGTIGTIAVPLAITVTNGLAQVSMGGAVGGISGNLTGSVNPNDTLTIIGTPPGIVRYNGIQLFPLISIALLTSHLRDFFAPLLELLQLTRRPSPTTL